MQNNNLKGKIAVITGCNKGIGKAILSEYAKNGVNCICCVRSISDDFKTFCENLIKECNVKVSIVKMDLSDNKLVSESVKEIFKISKKIDILVNNAGVLFNSLFFMTSDKQLKNLFQINFFSHVFLTQLITREMIKNKKGNVIFISSTSADGRDYGRFAYSSSKAAISSVTRVLASELGSYGIRVNSINPGLTDTDLMRKNTLEKNIKIELSKTSLNRIASPNEIANVAVFLASDLSSYINGQNLRVDGGLQ